MEHTSSAMLRDATELRGENKVVSSSSASPPVAALVTPMEPPVMAPAARAKKAQVNTSPLPPCKICGAKASGLHYGVNSCEACKGFFRRAIKYDRKYRCFRQQRCDVVGGRSVRTSCPYCRLQKCLDMGMAHAAIKTGRYTHAKRTENILEVKRLQKGSLSPGDGRPSPEKCRKVFEKGANFFLNDETGSLQQHDNSRKDFKADTKRVDLDRIDSDVDFTAQSEVKTSEQHRAIADSHVVKLPNPQEEKLCQAGTKVGKMNPVVHRSKGKITEAINTQQTSLNGSDNQNTNKTSLHSEKYKLPLTQDRDAEKAKLFASMSESFHKSGRNLKDCDVSHFESNFPLNQSQAKFEYEMPLHAFHNKFLPHGSCSNSYQSLPGNDTVYQNHDMERGYLVPPYAETNICCPNRQTSLYTPHQRPWSNGGFPVSESHANEYFRSREHYHFHPQTQEQHLVDHDNHLHACDVPGNHPLHLHHHDHHHHHHHHYIKPLGNQMVHHRDFDQQICDYDDMSCDIASSPDFNSPQVSPTLVSNDLPPNFLPGNMGVPIHPAMAQNLTIPSPFEPELERSNSAVAGPEISKLVEQDEIYPSPGGVLIRIPTPSISEANLPAFIVSEPQNASSMSYPAGGKEFPALDRSTVEGAFELHSSLVKPSSSYIIPGSTFTPIGSETSVTGNVSDIDLDPISNPSTTISSRPEPSPISLTLSPSLDLSHSPSILTSETACPEINNTIDAASVRVTASSWSGQVELNKTSPDCPAVVEGTLDEDLMKFVHGQHGLGSVANVVKHLEAVHKQFNATVIDEDHSQLKLRALQYWKDQTARSETFGFQNEFVKDEVYEEIYSRTGIEIDHRRTRLEQVQRESTMYFESLIRFSLQLPGFGDLHIEDQVQLIYCTFLEQWFLNGFQGFYPDLNIVIMPRGHPYTKADIAWIVSEEFAESAFSMASRFQALPLNRAIIAMWKAVILLASDRVPLRDADRVRSLQEGYLRLLQAYTRNVWPLDTSLLGKIVSASVKIREIGHITKPPRPRTEAELRGFITNVLLAEKVKVEPGHQDQS